MIVNILHVLYISEMIVVSNKLLSLFYKEQQGSVLQFLIMKGNFESKVELILLTYTKQLTVKDSSTF